MISVDMNRIVGQFSILKLKNNRSHAIKRYLDWMTKPWWNGGPANWPWNGAKQSPLTSDHDTGASSKTNEY